VDLALRGQRYQRIVDARYTVVVLFGDHECGQVGGVAGREDDGEQRPDARHKPTGHTTNVDDEDRDQPYVTMVSVSRVDTTGHTTRIVDADRRSEQHGPDQPERAKQRELVFYTAKIRPTAGVTF